MEKKERILKIKEELKAEAKKIRRLKIDCKNTQRGIHTGEKVWQEDVSRARYVWRHKHIAYCLLRGRKIEDIERKVREGNEPNQRLIEKHIEAFTSEVSDD